MNIEYYIKKLNKNLDKLPPKKQDQIVAEINDLTFSDLPQKSKQTKIKSIFKKYFK